MTKTRFLALLSVLALLAAMPLASVFAQQPVPPQKFYGMVMVDGEAPPEGSTVIATVTTMMTNEEGEEVTETMEIGMAMTDAMGNYVLETDADSTLAGKEVMFQVMVMGMEESEDAMPSMMMDEGMMAMEEPIMWMQGNIRNVDLEVGESMMTPRRPQARDTHRPHGPRGPARVRRVRRVSPARWASTVTTALGARGSRWSRRRGRRRRLRRRSRPRRRSRFRRR